MPPTTEWIEYRGPHPAVDVPLQELRGVPARTPIEVPPHTAAALADQDNGIWVRVPAPKAAKADDKAGPAGREG